MQEKTYRVLFLSQRNSARSIMAEAMLNTLGRGRFRAYSAGVRPVREYDPVAVELLAHANVKAPEHGPQHYAAFNTDDASPLDFVFTLSDTAAGEAPPTWPGQPVTAHWGCTDPTRFADPAERRLALIRTRTELERRLRLLLNLPLESLDRMSLQQHVDRMDGEHAGHGQ
jgi:arsenate reductase